MTMPPSSHIQPMNIDYNNESDDDISMLPYQSHDERQDDPRLSWPWRFDNRNIIPENMDMDTMRESEMAGRAPIILQSPIMTPPARNQTCMFDSSFFQASNRNTQSACTQTTNRSG
jgi:hypothetical protein